MAEMYNIIYRLCNERGISTAKMCKEADIPKSAITELKKGRTKQLSSKTLQKVASYFNVSSDYLLGINKEIPSIINDKGDNTKDWSVFAMDGHKGKHTEKIKMETLDPIVELVEVVRKLPKEKVEALLNLAKNM